MAGRFIELKEAAQLLGMSAEELNEKRESGDIHGYRDGASWKFKTEEIERYAEEHDIQPGATAASSESSYSDEDLDHLINVGDSSEEFDSDDEVDASSILVSDEAAGKEGSTSSTVIGMEEQEDAAPGSSDLKLAPAEDGDLALGSDVGSDVSLVADSSEGSDVKLVPEEDSESGSSLAGDLEVSGSDLAMGSDLTLESASDLSLGEEDDDLVLGGSGLGSDLTLQASDSGINLASPSDSGLSLEASDLAASSGSLELPEDEDLISVEPADSDESSDIQQDEEFLLSPSGEMFGDESSDSGSQVIALEDSEAFDSGNMVEEGQPGLLDEAMGGEAPQFDPAVAALTPDAAVGVAVVPELPEAPYSIFNVLGLLLIVAMLTVTGMLLTDVVRNMWSWESGTSTTTSLMNMIIEALGMN